MVDKHKEYMFGKVMREMAIEYAREGNIKQAKTYADRYTQLMKDIGLSRWREYPALCLPDDK